MKLDNICNQVYAVAVNEARIQNHEYITPEHFLYAALMFEAGKDLIVSCGGNLQEIQKELLDYFENYIPKNVSENPVDSYEFVKMFELAMAQAHINGSEVVFLSNIFIAIYSLPQSFASYILLKNGVNRISILKAVAVKTEVQNEEKETEDDEDTVFLKSFTTELVLKAKAGQLDPLVGREDILERTIQVLCRRLKNNPVHVGDPGVGKTAIVEGLAQRVNSKENIPEKLKNAQIFYVDLGLLLAGTKYRGDFEERLVKLVNIISKYENPIIYLDEIHTVVGAGSVSGGGMDASSIFKPFLAKGHIKFIGSTTYEEYKKYFEKDRALTRRFQKIDVPEPDIDESIKILLGIKQKYENYHNVSYSQEIIELTCKLADKHINDRAMPDKAIDVLDEAGAFLRMNSSSCTAIAVEEKDIERTVALIAKVPVKSISGSETDKLKNLKSELSDNIFGQDEAINTVVSAIKASRSGLNEREKPVASLLFVGPTGVGKTEVCKQLAEHLNIKLLRYDMSEYQEKHSVARLIGSPPGYVGFEEGGLLTEAIRKTPHCVLLLDEIEKAHTDIYNVLLQIMDYGTLTDNIGKKADFRNVILIMTSNAGAKEIGRRIIGYDEKRESSKAIDKAVENIFSPEFRNRLDEIVVFRHVDKDMAILIAKKAISKLCGRLKDKNVVIEATEVALNFIAEKGFSEQFGAREIIRTVEKDIKSKLVDEVLFGKLAKGGFAEIDVSDGEIIIKIQ